MADIWKEIVTIVQGIKAGTWAVVIGGIVTVIAAVFHGPVVDAIVAGWTALKGLLGQ